MAEQQAYAAQEIPPANPSLPYQPRPESPAPAEHGIGEDLVGQLRRLGDLHSSGVLSDSEFAAAKKQILG